MDYIKNILNFKLNITIILFSIIMTFNINSSNVQTKAACKDVLVKVFNKINENVINSQSVEGREHHLDELFKFLKTQYKKDEGDGEGDKSIGDIELGVCFAVPLENDIAIKLIRMLYGENVNKPLMMYASIWGKIWNQEITVDEEKLNADTDFLNFIPQLIISFNNIVFSIATFLLVIIYGRSLLSMLYEKDPSKLKNNSKNISKIILGLTLIAPIELFGNFSLIQYIFIMLIIFSILLAKVLWMLIVLSMNFSYMEKDVTELIYDEGIIPNYLTPTIDNVLIHTCDILKRERIINEFQYEFNNNIEELKKNAYYQCLTTPLSNDKREILNFGKTFYPDQILKGLYCARTHKKIKSNQSYCGSLVKYTTEGEEESSKSSLKKEAYEALDLESSAYQSIMRNLAYDLLSSNCKQDTADNKISTKTSEFVCAKIKVGSGEYVYNPETNLILFNNSKVNEPNMINQESENLKNKYSKLARDHFTSRIPKLALTIANSKFKQDSIIEEVDDFISLYEKGFAMAGTIFYERVNLLIVDRMSVKLFKNIYNVRKPIGFFKNLPLVIPGKNGTIKRATETDEVYVMREQLNTLINFNRYISDVIDVDLVSVGTDIVDYGTDVLNKDESNSLLMSWDDISKTKTSCIEDYQKCKLVAINPFLELMDSGHEMIGEGVFFQAVTYGLNLIVKAMTSERDGLGGTASQLLEFIQSIFGLYALIGFFFAILIPFIPFFIYASLIFGWIIQTLKVLLVSQLLSVYFLIPNEKEDFVGDEIKIYKLLFKTALQPLLLLTGFLVCIMLANISITLINVWLSIIQDTLGLNNGSGMLINLLNNVIGIIMYAVFITLAVVKSAEAIAVIPKSMSKWLDIEIEEEKAFSKVQELIEAHIIPKLKVKSLL